MRRDADRHLEYGFRVERHLQNGDIVLFNRQPSLHKMSMMGHRVRILPHSTFRLNLSVTSPYNADFDGDEMNMHVPQTLEARAEAMAIMAVPRNIVSPQANKPVIGIVQVREELERGGEGEREREESWLLAVAALLRLKEEGKNSPFFSLSFSLHHQPKPNQKTQDTLLGCRLMTARDSFIEKDVAFNMMMWLEDWDGRVPMPALLKPRPRWTGKQFISAFLPPGVNCRRTTSWYRDGEPADMSPTDSQVLIQGGQLLTGTLCKKTLGASAGSLVHVIWADEGPEAARAFLSQCQVSEEKGRGGERERGWGKGSGERRGSKKKLEKKRKKLATHNSSKKNSSRTLFPHQYITNYWLLQHGFSIGIGDTVADARTMAIISRTIEGAEAEVKRLTQKLQARELEAQPGRSMMESFENQVNQVLNKARDDAGRQAQASLKDTNNVVRMVTAGSKGSFINISQMIACVGKEEVIFRHFFLSFYFRGRENTHTLNKIKTNRPTKRRGKAHPLWVRRPHPPALHQGRPGPRVPRLRLQLVPFRINATGALFPRDGRPRGAHRHGRQDVLDGVHSAQARQGDGGLLDPLRRHCARRRRGCRPVFVRRGRDGRVPRRRDEFGRATDARGRVSLGVQV